MVVWNILDYHRLIAGLTQNNYKNKCHIILKMIDMIFKYFFNLPYFFFQIMLNSHSTQVYVVSTIHL